MADAGMADEGISEMAELRWVERVAALEVQVESQRHEILALRHENTDVWQHQEARAQENKALQKKIDVLQLQKKRSEEDMYKDAQAKYATYREEAGAAGAQPEESNKRTPEEQEELIQLQHDELVAFKEQISVLKKQIERQVAVCQAVGDETEKRTILEQASEIIDLRCKLQELEEDSMKTQEWNDERHEDSMKKLRDSDTQYMQTLQKIQAEHTSQQARVESSRVLTDKAVKRTQAAEKELANLQAAHAKLAKDNGTLLTDNNEATKTLQSLAEKNDRLAEKNARLTVQLREAMLEVGVMSVLRTRLQDRENKIIALGAEVEQFQEAALRHIAGRERAKNMAESVILATETALPLAENVAEGSLTLVERLLDAIVGMQDELSRYCLVLPPELLAMHLNNLQVHKQMAARAASAFAKEESAAKVAALEAESVVKDKQLEDATEALEVEKKSTMEMQLECVVCKEGTSSRRVLPCAHWLCEGCAGICKSCPFCNKEYKMEETQKLIL